MIKPSLLLTTAATILFCASGPAKDFEGVDLSEWLKPFEFAVYTEKSSKERDQRLGENLDKIVIGMKIQDVLLKLGPPTWELNKFGLKEWVAPKGGVLQYRQLDKNTNHYLSTHIVFDRNAEVVWIHRRAPSLLMDTPSR